MADRPAAFDVQKSTDIQLEAENKSGHALSKFVQDHLGHPQPAAKDVPLLGQAPAFNLAEDWHIWSTDVYSPKEPIKLHISHDNLQRTSVDTVSDTVITGPFRLDKVTGPAEILHLGKPGVRYDRYHPEPLGYQSREQDAITWKDATGVHTFVLDPLKDNLYLEMAPLKK